MAIRLEETFEVEAPAERVWSFLLDPRQVVRCLPGAELMEAQDEDTFTGRVRIKVGPVTASYQGKATYVERDAGQRLVRLVGEGRESGGSGSARMTMLSRLVELPGGRTEVRVEAELEVVGRIVQFGRGMIEEVNRQLFRQFASCARGQLAGPAEGAAADPPVGNPVDAPAPAPSPTGEPVRATSLLMGAVGALLRRFLGRLLNRGR